MAAQNTISSEAIKASIQENLAEQGIQISRGVIDLICREYSTEMIRHIENGDCLELLDVGLLEPSWRRVASSFAPKGYTSKINLRMNPELKDRMNHNLVKDASYQQKLGASNVHSKEDRK